MASPPSKRFFPAFLDLEGRLVVIIGCGAAAEKRAKQFARYAADVTVICPTPTELLLAGEADGALTVEQRPYVRGDLTGASMVICTETDAEVQRAVFEEASAVGCLVNVADAPEYSNFLISGVVRQGRLELAISTGGSAPEAAKALRKHLNGTLGAEWGAWTDLIVETRTLATTALAQDPAAQATLLSAVTDPSVRERLAAGERLTAENILAETGLAAATTTEEP